MSSLSDVPSLFKRVGLLMSILMLILVSFGLAQAAPAAPQATAPLLADTYSSRASGTETQNFNGQALDIAYSSGAGGVSNPTKIIFLKFDLSGVATPITSARLTLATLGGACANGAISPASISVFGVTNNSWTETGLNWNNQPAAATSALETTTVSTIGAQYWSPSGSAALGQWLESQRAGGAASLRLEITTATNNDILFEDREGSGAAADCPSAGAPVLDVSGTPTAVTLQSFGGVSTTDAGEVGPWVAVLGLVAALIVLVRRHYLPTN